MKTLRTLGANPNTPLSHGSGQNNENIKSLFSPLPCLRGVLELAPSVSNVLIFCSLPCLRGVLEFASSVSNVLIILSTSMS
jgi:hypothetical protein